MSQAVRKPHSVAVTIASGETESDEFPIGGSAFGTIQFPAAMTGASLNFQAANGAGSFVTATEADGTALSLAVDVSTIKRLPDELFGAQRAKLVSASAKGCRPDV